LQLLKKRVRNLSIEQDQGIISVKEKVSKNFIHKQIPKEKIIIQPINL